MASILVTLFVSFELFAVGFAFARAITEGGWWMAGLIAYAVWLLYLGGSIGKVMLTLGAGIVLAIAYLLGGFIASLVVYGALLLFGEMFMKPTSVDEEE
ncbi:MAG: hypothetical protein HQL07_16225 [Nitrospirae bacterium]|nr:hypothetical protein [Magnetococcales bacterium]